MVTSNAQFLTKTQTNKKNMNKRKKKEIFIAFSNAILIRYLAYVWTDTFH